MGIGTHGYYTPGKGIDAETGQDANPAVSSIWRRRCWYFCGTNDITWLRSNIVLLLGVIGNMRGSAIRHRVSVQTSFFLEAGPKSEEEAFAPSLTIILLLYSYVTSMHQGCAPHKRRILRIVEVKTQNE